MYDDYMQNSFGVEYSPYQNTYEPSMARSTNFYNQMDECTPYGYDINYYDFPMNFMQQNFSSRNLITDVENLYPEIYKIIYPMVQKACFRNNRHITEDILDEMTDDIYHNIEADNIVNLNINIENNRADNKSLANTKNASNENIENRQVNNPIRDLIRILLIRELFGRPGPNRPPKPFPPRPPMHGHPGNPPRPPRVMF